MQQITCKYLVYGREIGESLTPHLQGTIAFECNKRLSGVRKLVPRAHWEPTRRLQESVAYCKKDGNVYESGVLPLTKSECAKKGIAERWALARSGKFEELPPENIKTYEYIYRKSMVVESRSELLNEWRCGDSGSGKSSGVRRDYGDSLYVKDATKWWDGYAGEETVVIDDWDPETTKYLRRYLKIWADHYPFKAEVKGGSMEIRPKRVIVTSQYTIEMCFPDEKDYEAINRRFETIFIGNLTHPQPMTFTP